MRSMPRQVGSVSAQRFADVTSSVVASYLTVDLEDAHEGWEFDDAILDDGCEWSVGDRTETLLALLAKHDARATFFCTHAVAQRFRSLLRTILSGGHSLGVHGKSHQLVYRLSRAQFRTDIAEAKQFLEDICGQVVQGYRAPAWSIRRHELDRLDDLRELGFTYDSSIFPVQNYLYGIAGAPIVPYRHPNGLIEIPISIARYGKLLIPFGGGIYARLLPKAVLMLLARRTLRLTPLVLYVHPWELGNGANHSLPLSIRERLIRSWGTSTTMGKFDALLSLARFRPLEESAWLHQEQSLAVVDLRLAGSTVGFDGQA